MSVALYTVNIELISTKQQLHTNAIQLIEESENLQRAREMIIERNERLERRGEELDKALGKIMEKNRLLIAIDEVRLRLYDIQFFKVTVKSNKCLNSSIEYLELQKSNL